MFSVSWVSKMWTLTLICIYYRHFRFNWLCLLSTVLCLELFLTCDPVNWCRPVVSFRGWLNMVLNMIITTYLYCAIICPSPKRGCCFFVGFIFVFCFWGGCCWYNQFKPQHLRRRTHCKRLEMPHNVALLGIYRKHCLLLLLFCCCCCLHGGAVR